MPISDHRSIQGSRAGRLAAGLAGAALVAATSLTASGQEAASRPSVEKSVKVGTGLYEIVASPSTGTVYVASAGSRTQKGAAIYALDGDTLAVTKTVDVTAAPAYGLGLNDRTQTLYTTNTRDGSVSAIDLAAGRVVATIASDVDKSAHLREIAVDEESNTVYVSSFGREGLVWVIDGKTNTLSHHIENVGNGTSGLALDQAAKRLYVANIGANEVAVIDLATRQVVQRFPAGGERPTNLAFDPKTARLFVANQGTGNVTVLDAKEGKLLATVATGEGALDVEHQAGTGLVYAANRGAGTVTVFDAASYDVRATLQTGSAPNTVAVDAKTGLVYVTNKTRPMPRGGAPRTGDAGAPATPPPPPPDDPNGDTVTVIKP